MTAIGLALGWGALVLAVSRRIVARVVAADRALALARPGVANMAGAEPGAWIATRTGRGLDRLGVVGRVARGWTRRRVARRRDERLARELPSAVDLLGVAISAGATPFAAVETVAQWAPEAIGGSFAAIVASCRLGSSFDAALMDTQHRDPRLAPLMSVLATGSRLGAAVNDALDRLAGESRRDLRRRAEARARTVPVHLLFPLVFLVLPAFGLLTVVPAVASGFRGF